MGTYSEGELFDDPEAFETALSSIEPLSDKSLKAIANLARYKPPPDPCKHTVVFITEAKRLIVVTIHSADPFPEGRSAVLVVLFGSRSGENLNVLLSTRSHNLRTYVSTSWFCGSVLGDGLAHPRLLLLARTRWDCGREATRAVMHS